MLWLYIVSSRGTSRFSSATLSALPRNTTEGKTALCCGVGSLIRIISTGIKWESIFCCELLLQSRLLNSSRETDLLSHWISLQNTRYYLLFPYSLCRCRFANIIQHGAAEGGKDEREKVTKLPYRCLLVQQFRASFLPQLLISKPLLGFQVSNLSFLDLMLYYQEKNSNDNLAK